MARSSALTLAAGVFGIQYGEFGLPEPQAVLDTVLVDPAFERRGVARTIFEQLLLNLRALRIERVRTEVAWNDHELAAFFDSMGFEPAARLVLETEILSE